MSRVTRPAARSRITLLTDFGTIDGYVGAMKGVIASILPHAVIDDISHDIPAGDVAAAAWCLHTSWRFHPAGTVHVCVVDPGVGGARRALAAEIAGQFFVAPDNGVLTHPLRESGGKIVEITNPQFMRATVSSTFHGRDIFAVAAAHLATGEPLAALGPALANPVLLPQHTLGVDADGVTGEVVHVDRFGNMITNIAAARVRAGGAVVLPDRDHQRIRVVRTYSDAEAGELVALIGSADVLEIAVRDGSAADRLGAGRGLRVKAADAEPELRNVRSVH